MGTLLNHMEEASSTLDAYLGKVHLPTLHNSAGIKLDNSVKSTSVAYFFYFVDFGHNDVVLIYIFVICHGWKLISNIENCGALL